MARLEDHALNFWKLMQKWKHSPFPVSRQFAETNELPTLAASTPFPKLSSRIYREINAKEPA